MYVCESCGDGIFTLEIVRPEGVAPFGNAMRFIDSNQADFSGVYHLDKAFIIEPFRGYISESTLISFTIRQ